ncbi:carbohydrate ABC transporter substrate-binding protein (CUT1 family) [Hydrogenispora ethanolica]|uniref:Carbohydrate ABC transporter substrate-binding protein (CUT1 family) n=1 Tax=Hydrogenispora ethanolica TaxID=1082276 RepID=A0A4R1R8E0_HYDET|nr:ABC transporter substrate-binding protein [Hydrogenispora ethanolica]TCL61924.1 carbohydrate ABC transporter substrate-binding protein (CUT1 family) [Hydrogenispora ethanolica]
MKKANKKILSVLFVLVMGLSLTAANAAAPKVKLRMWNIFPGAVQDAFKSIVHDYNASQDKVEVVPEYIPLPELKKQLSIGMAGDDLPDLVTVDNPDQAAFSAMGVFEDITQRLAKWKQVNKFFKGPIQSTIYNKRQYGLPFYSNCLALFYNETMLQEAGVKPPRNFGQVMEATKKLTTKEHYGLAICAARSEEGTFQFLPWLIASGGNFAKLDDAKATRALQMWTDLVKKGYMSKEVINWGQPDVEKQFAAGKAAMMINGPWQISNLKKDAPDLKWNVALFPKDKKEASVLGGYNIAILKGKQVNESFQFLTYLCSKNVMAKFCRLSGHLPARSDVAQDDTWQKDPILKTFMDQMKYAMPRGPHPKWPEFSGAIQIAIQEALSGFKTPAQALKDASKKVNIVQ